VPAVLRTSANASSATINNISAYNLATFTFLAFNNGVRDRGDRLLTEMHLAYHFRGLSVLRAWDAGYGSWALVQADSGVRVLALAPGYRSGRARRFARSADTALHRAGVCPRGPVSDHRSDPGIIEEIARARQQAARATGLEVLAAELARLDAEYALAKARAKIRKNPR
jgi:hypothetical protein